MSEPKRRALAIGGDTGAIAAKLVVGAVADATRRTLILQCRGPVDMGDTIVAFTYAQLKHYAAQLAQQEAELELNALGGKPINIVEMIQLEAIGVLKVRVADGNGAPG